MLGILLIFCACLCRVTIAFNQLFTEVKHVINYYIAGRDNRAGGHGDNTNNLSLPVGKTGVTIGSIDHLEVFLVTGEITLARIS